jgi:hypothetical protein
VGGGSTWAAVAVGVAPYAVCLLIYLVFMIGYIAALIRCVSSGPEIRKDMERLIAVSANCVVGILALRPVAIPDGPDDARRPPQGAAVRARNRGRARSGDRP